MEILKLLSTSEVVAQLVSFLLLLVILRLFAWKPLLKLLDDRKARIAAELKQAEESLLGAEKLKEEYQDKINRIEDTARTRLQEAVEEARKTAEEIRRQAQEEAQRIIDSAREDIRYEIAKAKEELKDRIVDLTIRATEDIIQEKLTEEQDKKLVYDFLKRVDELE